MVRFATSCVAMLLCATSGAYGLTSCNPTKTSEPPTKTDAPPAKTDEPPTKTGAPPTKTSAPLVKTNEPHKIQEATMNAPLAFKASVTKSDNELRLAYEVSNHSERDAYLVNRLYRTSPSIVVSPDLIYVHLEPETKTIWLNKQIPDIPTTVTVTSPKAPFVTPLRKGEVFREEVHIPIPVKEYREYNVGPKTDQREQVTYEHVRFTLQYYWRTDGMIETTREIGGVSVVVPTGGAPLKRSDFEILTMAPVKLQVPVLAPKP